MDKWTTAAVAIVIATLSDKAMRPKIRKAMLKLFTSIGNVYAQDADFQSAAAIILSSRIEK